MANVLAPNILNTIELTHTLPLVDDERRATRFELSVGVFRIVVPSNHGGTLRVGFHDPEPYAELSLVVIDPHGARHFRHSLEATELAIRIKKGEAGSSVFYAVVQSPKRDFWIYAKYQESGWARDALGKPLIPWNFWFFPFQRESRHGASAFKTEQWDPLGKYEKAFGAHGVMVWELDHHSDYDQPREEWAGHCSVIAPASILFEEPPPLSDPINGVRFTGEEVKLLLGEVVGRYVQFGDDGWKLPEKLNKDGPDEGIKPGDDDRASKRFAAPLLGLLKLLRSALQDRGAPLVMGFRDAAGNTPSAVWNHVVYRFETTYRQYNLDDLRVVQATTVLHANADAATDGSTSGLPTTHGGAERHLVYTVRFDRTGQLGRGTKKDIPHSDDRWIRCGVGAEEGYAIRHAYSVKKLGTEVITDGIGNEMIERSNVLRLAKLRELPP